MGEVEVILSQGKALRVDESHRRPSLPGQEMLVALGIVATVGGSHGICETIIGMGIRKRVEDAIHQLVVVLGAFGEAELQGMRNAGRKGF